MATSEPGVFADVLRRLRLERGLTQERLAERAGIALRSLSDLERALVTRPRRQTAAMLADGLGLTGADSASFLAAARGLPAVMATTGERPPLPQPAGQLLGRERELRFITEALLSGENRLVTLTGPGGVGKTRLALETAHQAEIAAHFAGGVEFVRLDGLHDPALVLAAIADALRLLETGGASPLIERLAARLLGWPTLIVLDNLEHLLAAGHDLGTLLDRAPGLSILVTSREASHLPIERVIRISPLPRPDPATWQAPGFSVDLEAAPAVALFLQRAAAVSSLEIDPATDEGRANLAAIAETCFRLDGLPLAVELAAAQTHVLSPAAILALLANAGLPLLSVGARDQPARLQTMDAAISWSYHRLTAEEQALFRALSVFAGGFCLQAAASVAAGQGATVLPLVAQRSTPRARNPMQIRMMSRDPALGHLARGRDPMADLDPSVIGSVASLVRQNLIVQDPAVPDHTTFRFRMLEPLRLFGLDRLRAADEEAMVRWRHALYFAELAETLDALAFGPDPEVWLGQQMVDLDNFRAAQDGALAAGENDLAVRLTAAIAQLWLIKGLLPEARQRVAAAIAVDAASSPEYRWFLRFWAGTFAFDAGDVARAAAHARELLAIAEDSDDPVGVGVGLTLLSRVMGASAEGHVAAANLARRAVDILQPLGQGEWTAWAWSRLGIAYHRLGRLAEARACLLHSLELRQQRQCEGCASYSLALLGAVSSERGQPHAAVAAYLDCLDLAMKHHNPPLLLAALFGLADVTWHFGATPDAARTALLLCGAGEALRERHGLSRSPAAGTAIARWQTPMRLSLGDETIDGLIAQGRELSPAAICDLAEHLRVTDRRRPEESGEIEVSLLTALESIE